MELAGMEIKRQRGSATPNSQTGIIVSVAVIAAIIGLIVMVSAGHGRHQHRAKLVKTKNHQIYVENDGGSTYTFVESGGDGVEIELPRDGSSSFKLPPGSWVKARPPKEAEIAEEEEQTIEESDSGQPEADASGDVGADSHDADSGGGDSGAGDSGGDSGGEGGGGDGG